MISPMDSSSISMIVAIALLVMMSAYFSATETAFSCLNKIRMKSRAESGDHRAALAMDLVEDYDRLISTILIGNNIALVIYGILMARLVNGMLLTPLGIHHPNGECPNEAICLLIQTLLGTAITIVTGEFLPKTLFRINPNRMLTICALPAYIIYILLWPISKFTSSLSKVTLWLLGQKPSKEDTDRTFKKADLDYLIQSNIERAEEGGGIEDEVKIFQNALDFSSVKVRDCTIPRTEINAVDDQTDTATLLNTFVESGHSKIIVYREDIDNIIGFIHSSEMFRLSKGDDWRNCVKDVPIVPETMNAQKLLSTFISQKRSIAVVVDEFGGTSGIVTLEDLVEEIFGDIEDEHDNVSYVATDLGGGEYMLSGRLEIQKANETLGLELPESDEYLTVGGLILHEYQSFPKLNEVIRFGHWEFKIMKKTTTKIELVKLKVLD